VERERRALHERDKARELAQTGASRTALRSPPAKPGRDFDPYLDWLDAPKNLPGRALAEASGLVRVRNPDGTIRQWVERSQVDQLLVEGWTLA